MSYQILKKKIIKQKIKIAVIGLGYVGLPLALSFAQKKIKVIGFDNDIKKIILLKKKKSYISSIKSIIIKKVINNLNFFPTDKFHLINKCEVIIVCVPTPINKNKVPVMRYVEEVVKQLNLINLKDKLIIFECTSYPGTTEEFLLPVFKKYKLTIGKNIFLGYSPEREDPGNKKFSLLKGNIPKIVSGQSKNCLKLVNLVYSKITNLTFPVSDIKTAEFTKLLENIYRSVNIGLINEMKTISDKFKINIYESIEAAKTKPFGFSAFNPGPGVGGHCIPVDPYFLSWKASKLGLKTEFINLAGKINDLRPYQVVKSIKSYFLNKSIKKLKCLILGLSYKKNSDDIRMSPALVVQNRLRRIINKVYVFDKYLPKKIGILENIEILKKKDITEKFIKKLDFVLILTDHDKINYNYYQKNAKIIFDTRNVFKKKIFKNVVLI